jgi:molecular chaperone GrpE (heat shock protein)
MNGVNNQNQENQKNKGLLAELVGKLNGTIPRQPHETDEYLKTQIAVVQKDIKDGEERYNQMLADLNKMRKSLLEENLSLMKILGLDKMKTMDKIILGGGIILIIYLLKS